MTNKEIEQQIRESGGTPRATELGHKLPEISKLRGLGDPMFFTFSLEKKDNLLVCHAVIMGTFVMPADRPLDLCRPDDDPRLPHFIKYLEHNEFMRTKKEMKEEVRKQYEVKLAEKMQMIEAWYKEKDKQHG